VVPPDPAPNAAPTESAPEALPLELYAAVRVGFWRRGEGPRRLIEDAARDHGLDEDAFHEEEQQLLRALATEAEEGRSTLARALRAAMKRESRAVARGAAS
jgi:hypothetical protein